VGAQPEVRVGAAIWMARCPAGRGVGRGSASIGRQRAPTWPGQRRARERKRGLERRFKRGWPLHGPRLARLTFTKKNLKIRNWHDRGKKNCKLNSLARHWARDFRNITGTPAKRKPTSSRGSRQQALQAVQRSRHSSALPRPSLRQFVRLALCFAEHHSADTTSADTTSPTCSARRDG